MLCPHCGDKTNARRVYCRECGWSVEHGIGATTCAHPPAHDGFRELHCAGCGNLADREGVILDSGRLVPYPHSVIGRYLRGKRIGGTL